MSREVFGLDWDRTLECNMAFREAGRIGPKGNKKPSLDDYDKRWLR